MALDPQTGQYKLEDDSVSTHVTGLMSQSSPFMQQARTQGLQSANRRGLLNSSMGVQASQAAAYQAALPIASQEASQAFQKNLSGQGYQQQYQLAEQGFGHQKALAEQGFGHQQQLLTMELGSRERLQMADLAAQKERLGMQITSQEKLALQDLKAAMDRLNVQTGSQEKIAQMNIAAHDRQYAMSAAVAMENSYAEMFRTIASAHDLPAAARDQYLQHIGAIRDANLNLVEQLYGIDLQWPSAGYGVGGSGAGQTPPPPPSAPPPPPSAPPAPKPLPPPPDYTYSE